MDGPRKLYVKSFGCQMNVYDSRRMADTLAPQGYVETASAEDADLVILNTCHIREKAVEKVYSELGRVRRMKEAAAAAGRRLVIAVAGCVAQAEGEEIIRRQPAVDLVFGPQSYHRLPELLARAARDGKAVATEFAIDDKFDHLAAPSAAAIRTRGVSAFVTVQEGCDKFCTFCVVPYTRGAEISRPVRKILAEVEHLAAAGVREVTLIGQNVNAYHGDGPDGRPWSLARLLHRAAELDGIDRLRYTTSHPRDMNDDLIAAHRDLPELMPQLHLPVQSGSDRVLAAMNRRHTRADYLAVVERLRQARPDLALTSDFIVGFPGETESDFAATLESRRRGRLFRRILLQIFAAARNSRRRNGRPGRRRREVGTLAAPPGGDRPQPGGVQSPLSASHLRRAVRTPRPPPRSAGRPFALSATGASHRARRADRRNRRGDDHRRRQQQPVRRACAKSRATSRANARSRARCSSPGSLTCEHRHRINRSSSRRTVRHRSR